MADRLDRLYEEYSYDPAGHSEALFAEMLKVVKRLSRDEDLASSTMIDLLEKLPSYEHTGRFSRWVKTWSAMNRRDQRRKTAAVLKTTISFNEESVLPASQHRQYVDLSDVRDPLDRMIAEAILQGETITSIAELYGISRVTIHTRLRGLRDKVSVL